MLVIADNTADSKFIAADLLSQAEHDKLASAVLLTDSGEKNRAVPLVGSTWSGPAR